MRTLIAILLVLAPAVARAQMKKPDWSKTQIKATKVAGSVYMLEGTGDFNGGNIGALVGPDGIVIVDSKFAELAPKVQAALKTVGATADRPVKYVINTHFHGDHTNGNIVFGKTATIIAHDNSRKRILEAGVSMDGKTPAPPAALPIITF